MTKKKVLMIIPGLDFGGAQRVFSNVAADLSTKFEIIECAFNLTTITPYVTRNKLYSLDVPGGRNLFEKIYFFILRVIRLRKLKHELGIDISVSHLEGADYINILSARGEKIVFCIHGSKIYDKAIKGVEGFFRKKILIPFLYRRADLLIPVAHGIGKELMSEFKIADEKILVITNGVAAEKINMQSNETIEAELNLLFTKPVLITHGRIAFEKNQRLLIDVANHPDLRGKLNTVIIGDGPLLDTLINYSRKLKLNTYSFKESVPIGINHSVFFLGYMSNPFPLITKSSVYGFPSLYEGFPLALLEAMACGIPVVAADCPYGPQEILVESNSALTEYGVLLPSYSNVELSKEIEGWVKVILDLLKNPELSNKYRKASLKRVRDFSCNNIFLWERALEQIQ